MNNKQTIIEEIEEILTKYRCGIEWLMNDEDKPSGKVLSYTDTKHDIMALIQQQREQDKAEFLEIIGGDELNGKWPLNQKPKITYRNALRKELRNKLNQSEGEDE